MKKIIAFWSPYHGQTCTTSALLSTATSIAINYNLNILALHNQFIKSNLESAFVASKLSNKDILEFEDIGIDALEKLASSGRLQPKLIKNYTTTVSSRLDLIVGTTNPSYKMFSANLFRTVYHILENAKEVYDLIFIDLNSGQNEESNKIMELADIVVVCLNQNNKVLESYYIDEDFNSLLKDKEKLILINKYNRESKYSLSFIKKLYKAKDKLYSIPFNADFMDSHNDHRVYDFFSANNEVDRTDINFDFISSVKIFSESLVDLCTDDVVEKYPVARRNFAKIFSFR